MCTHRRAKRVNNMKKLFPYQVFFPCRIHFFTFWILIFSSSCRCLSSCWNYFLSPFFLQFLSYFGPGLLFHSLSRYTSSSDPNEYVDSCTLNSFLWSRFFYSSFFTVYFVSFQCCVSFFTRFHYPLSRLSRPKGVYSNVSQTILNPRTSEACTRPNW